MSSGNFCWGWVCYFMQFISWIRNRNRRPNLKILKRYSKAKRTRSPAYSRAQRRIKGRFPKGGSREAQVRFPEYQKGNDVMINRNDACVWCWWIHWIYLLTWMWYRSGIILCFEAWDSLWRVLLFGFMTNPRADSFFDPDNAAANSSHFH